MLAYCAAAFLYLNQPNAAGEIEYDGLDDSRYALLTQILCGLGHMAVAAVLSKVRFDELATVHEATAAAHDDKMQQQSQQQEAVVSNSSGASGWVSVKCLTACCAMHVLAVLGLINWPVAFIHAATYMPLLISIEPWQVMIRNGTVSSKLKCVCTAVALVVTSPMFTPSLLGLLVSGRFDFNEGTMSPHAHICTQNLLDTITSASRHMWFECAAVLHQCSMCSFLGRTVVTSLTDKHIIMVLLYFCLYYTGAKVLVGWRYSWSAFKAINLPVYCLLTMPTHLISSFIFFSDDSMFKLKQER
jgi:hypothetical protein